MRILTVAQPWATLIALGVKRIETRGYPARYEGDVAIHAAKGLDGIFKGATEHDLAWTIEDNVEIAAALAEHGLTAATLPRASVVAVARLVRSTAMTGDRIERLRREQPREAAFGFYETGRWAWVLDDLRPLPQPYPLRGGQWGAAVVPSADAARINHLAIETSVAA